MKKQSLKALASFLVVAVLLTMLPTAQPAHAATPVVNGLLYGDGDINNYDLLARSVKIPPNDRWRGSLYMRLVGPTLYVLMEVDRSVNDNVFADNSAADQLYIESSDWTEDRPADKLIGSDEMTFALTCGPNSWEWDQDYVDGSDPSDPSDWTSESGGDLPPGFLGSASSFQWNMINYASGAVPSWDVTLGGTRNGSGDWKSPATDGAADTDVTDEVGYAPTGDIAFDSVHGWEWPMIYEFAVDLATSGCGSNPITVEVITAHNSPSKDGVRDVPIEPTTLADWGDAPDPSYPTFDASNGASHYLVVNGPKLGADVDADVDGQATVGANGDDVLDGNDDEDGVVFLDALQPGQTADIQVTGSNGAYLDAWIDWNGNGTWEPGEQVATDFVLNGSAQIITVSVPGGSPLGETYARFRVTSTAGGVTDPTGLADDGEVEDYQVSIEQLGPVMTVSKDDGRTYVRPDETLVYVIVYENTAQVLPDNGATAYNVIITDVLPPGTTYAGAVPAPLSVTPGPGSATTVTWNVGTVPAQSGPQFIELSATVDSGVPGGTLLHNWVYLDYEDKDGVPKEREEDDDIDEVIEASLHKTVDQTSATPGDTLTYGLTMNYQGSALLTSALIEDVIPTGTTYVAGSANANGQYLAAENKVRWSLGSNNEAIPSSRPPVPPVTTETNGMAAWGDGDNTGMYNIWDGTAFGTAADTVNLGNALRTMAGASSPDSGEKIVAGVNSGSKTVAKIWTGSSWQDVSDDPNLPSPLGTVSQSYWHPADVAYESQSGEAVLVWNDSSQAAGSELRYSVWNGASWTAPASIAPPTGQTGEPKVIRLASNPGADEIVAVVSSTTGDYAQVWNGTTNSWGNAVDLYAAAQSDHTDVHVAYEQASGQALVVYGKNSNANLFYQTWAGSWSGESSEGPPTGITERVKWATLGSHVASDAIALGVLTTGGTAADTWVNVWDGAAWGTGVKVSDGRTASFDNPVPGVAVAFESTSVPGQAIVTYASATSGNSVLYRRYDGNTNTWLTETAGPMLGSKPNSMTLGPDPTSEQIMLAVQDDGSDLNYVLWNGATSTWGSPSLQESDTGETKNQPFLFLWDNIETVTSEISQSTDDAEEEGDDSDPHIAHGYVYPSSTDLELVVDIEPASSGTQKIGLRFNSLAVPQGATITEAYLTFYAIDPDSPNTNDDTTNLTIYGQDVDNAPTFPTTAYNITNRINSEATSATVAWSPAPWTKEQFYDTPELKTIVQEIVDRGGWSSGNSMVFMIAGSGSRSAESWNNSGTNPPRLTILYEPATAGGVPGTGISIKATPALVSHAGTIDVVMTVIATDAVADITPTSLTPNGYSGAGAGSCILTSPGSASIPDASTPVQFTWQCTASAGTPPDSEVTFSASATSPNALFEPATSNSVLVVPQFTFQVTIDDPATVDVVINQGTFSDQEVFPQGVPSNPVETVLTTGAIGNYIWLDENSDGYQDAGEPGLPNVRVILRDENGDQYAETWTDAQGGYLFEDLPLGDYFVDVDESTIPSSMSQTPPATLPGADFGNQDHSGQGYSVTLGGGEPLENLTADFGYNWNPAGDVNDPPTNSTGDPDDAVPGAIGDRVWVDADRDGVQDFNEPGIEGVELALYTDADGDGVYDDPVEDPNNSGNDYVVTTDDNGNYIFTDLPPGAYVVVVDETTLPTGPTWTQTGDPDHFGQTDTTPAANDGQTTVPVVLAPGDVFVNADFGYDAEDGELGSIGNTVWFDADADGVGPNNLNGDGLTGDPAQVGGPDNNETGIAYVTVSLIKDTNGNGVWDSGEPIIATAVTNANGQYLFEGLLLTDDGDGDATDADYLVWVNDSDNVLGELLPTYDRDGLAPASGQETGLGISATSLSTTTKDVTDQDFGYGPTHPLGTIGDTVWYDVDGSGGPQTTQGSEPGIPGVTVKLYADDGAGQPKDLNNDGVVNDLDVLKSTSTDANGNYLFDRLPFGTYVVEVDPGTLPAGFNTTPTYDSTGPADSRSQAIISAASPANRDQDFSYTKPGVGSIGDTIWGDLYAPSGPTPDVGEPGLAGVTVSLYDSSKQLVATTVTDANGNYLFTDLPLNDSYYVVVNPFTLPQGYLTQPTWDPDPASPPSNVSLVPLTTGSPHRRDQDWSFPPDPGNVLFSLGDTVWFDVDGSGGNQTTQGGEPGLPGVRVELYDLADNLLDSRVTDANGNYIFDGLPAGAYKVVVDISTLPAYVDTHSTYELDGNGDSEVIVGLGSGNANPRNVDFSYGPRIPGVIGDTIFFDANPGDGNAYNPGAGDTPIEGVVVELLDDKGNAIATTTTNENGHYSFGGLDPEDVTYGVRVAGSNFGPGGVLEGMSNTADPNGGLDSQSQTTLTPTKPVDLDQDFGYRGANGVIGNLLWLDTDADGFWDGADGPDGISGTEDDEPLIAGVTVDLYRDLNGNGQVDPGEPKMATAVTSATPTTTSGDVGNYLFTGLPTTGTGDSDPAAEYVVDVSDVGGVLAGYWHSLGTEGTTEHSQSDPYGAEISAGSPQNLTADFGYYVEPAALGNLVWNDGNFDGLQNDGASSGIPGVEVELTITYPDDTVVTVVTVTDADGLYSFGNLLLDEDYNGDGTVPEPSYEIRVKTTPDTGALAGLPYPSPLDAPTSTEFTDSNVSTGTPAQPVQGLTDVSPAADDTGPASYDFGFSAAPTGVEGVIVGAFKAEWQGDVIAVTWATVSELDVTGFDLYRSTSVGGEQSKLNAELIPVQVPGSPTGALYHFEDDTAKQGSHYYYWLHGIDRRGGTTPYGPAVVPAHQIFLPLMHKSP